MYKIKRNSYRYLCPILACFAWAALGPSGVEAKCNPSDSLTAGRDETFSLEFGGVPARPLLVHVPSSYNGMTPVPLVLDLHGFSSNGTQQMGLSGFRAASDKYGFIVVAPTGYANSFNGDIEFGSAKAENLDDVGFMKAIVKFISDKGNIHHGKVYVTGLSNGAAMTNTLGCQAADTFAGVAPVSDPLDIGRETCKPVHPISVLGFHGYSDAYVPYEGGPGTGPALPEPFPSIQDTLKFWAKTMSCTGTPELIPFQGNNKCEIYRKCGGGNQVGYCSLAGSHVLYNTQTALDIADYAWNFFDQFSLPLSDADDDGIPDQDDNCVSISNADQKDSNSNCVGDACECTNTADCDDGVYCNGSETCANGACKSGTKPCKTGQKCDETLRQCVSTTTKADGGTTGGSGAAGAKGGKNTGASGVSSGTGTAGRAAGVAGSPVGPSAGNENIGSAGSNSTAQQVAPNTDSGGCGCHVLGNTHGSALPFLSLLALLGIGVILLSSRRNKRVRSWE